LHEEHARHGSKLLDINMGDTLCTMGCVSPADSRKNVTVSRKNSACAPALMHSRSSTQSTQFVQASRQLCTNLVSQDHTKGAVRRLAHGFSHAHSSLFRTQPVHAAAPDADRGRAPLATVIFAVCANNGLQHPREAHLEADVHDECLDEQHEGEDAPQCQHHLHALRGEGPQRASLPPERPHLWVPPSTAHQVRLTRSSQLSCLICMQRKVCTLTAQSCCRHQARDSLASTAPQTNNLSATTSPHTADYIQENGGPACASVP